MSPTLVIFYALLISSLGLSISQIIYSRNNYTNQALNPCTKFMQLASGSILGITNTSEIIFLTKDPTSNKYFLVENVTIPKYIPFKLTRSSLHTARISKNEYLFPCVKSKSSDTLISLGYLNIETIDSLLYVQNTNEHIYEEQQQCGLINIPGKNYYFLMFISNLIGNMYQWYEKKTLFYLYHLNNTQNKFHYQEKWTHYNMVQDALGDPVHFLDKKIIVFVNYAPAHNYLQFSYLIEDLSFGTFETVQISDFMGNEDIANLSSIIFYSYDGNNKLSVSHDLSEYFYIHYLSLDSITGKLKYKLMDNKPRQGNHENINYYKLNNNYFIICASYDLVMYFYFFNYPHKKEINILNKNVGFLSSSVYLFPSYDESYLFLINHNAVDNTLNIYELDLINCLDGESFRINDLYFHELHLSSLIEYDSKLKTEIEETNLYISFSSLSQSLLNESLIEFKGISFEETQDEYKKIEIAQENDTSKVYRNISYKSNKLIKGIYKLSYVLYYKLPFSFALPTPICTFYLMSLFENYHCHHLETIDEAQHISKCDQCEPNYYPIKTTDEELRSIKNISIYGNCYNGEVPGYFFDSINQVYEKCFYLCESCYGYGDELNQNCSSCIRGYELFKKYKEDTESNNCVEYCNLNESTWHINKSSNRFECNYGEKNCIGEYLDYDPKTKECKYNEDMLNVKKNIEIISKCYMLNETINIINESPFIFFSPLITEFTGNNYKLFNYDSRNSSYKEKMDLGKCEEILYSHYNIPREEGFYISVIEIENYVYPTNQIEYIIFDKKGNRLDLSLCNESPITIFYSINGMNQDDEKYFLIQNKIDLIKSMKEIFNVDILNLSEPFFNDICFTFTSEYNKDIALIDRVHDFYINESYCDKGCLYNGIDLEKSIISCSCSPKNETIDKLEVRKKLEIPEAAKKRGSLLKCTKNIFKQNIFLNYGFYTSCSIFVAQAIHLIKIFSLVKQFVFVNPPKKKFSHKSEENKSKEIISNQLMRNPEMEEEDKKSKSKANVNLNLVNQKYLLNIGNANENICIREKLNNEINNENKENILNGENINKSNLNVYSKISMSNYLDNENNGLQLKDLNKKIPNNDIDLMKNQNLNKSNISTTKTDDGFEFDYPLGEDVSLKYKVDLKTRSVIEALKKKNIIGLALADYDLTLQKYIGLFIFISYLCFLLTVNCFLFTESKIRENYRIRQIYSLLKELPDIFSTCLFSILRSLFFRFLSSISPKSDNKKKVLIIFLVCIIIVDVFFCFFVILFCSVFVNSKKTWILNTFSTFILDIAFSLFSIALMFLFRYLGKKNNNNKTLYIFGEIVYII